MRRESSPHRLLPFQAFALALFGLVACGDDAVEVAPGRGVGDRVARPAAQVSGQVGAGRRAGAPMATALDRPTDRVPLEAVEARPIVVTETREGESETARVRDPAEELRSALGDPSSCLTEADRRLGRDISFQVEVDALRSGMVVDSRVSAPGVSDEAITCVRRAANSVRFAPFDERGRTVQTALILRLTPPG